jgi:hypothetical protein
MAPPPTEFVFETELGVPSLQHWNDSHFEVSVSFHKSNAKRIRARLALATATASEIKWHLVLSELVGKTANEDGELAAYLDGLSVGNGFKTVATGAHRSQTLSAADTEPSLMATYSAIAGLALAGALDHSTLDAASDLVSELKQESGWFYNPRVGDTMEERKFHNELTGEALAAARLVRLADASIEPLAALDQLTATMADYTPYVSCIAQIAETRSLLGFARLPHVAEFLTHHTVEGGSGFLPYLMEGAKIDEIAGHTQRFANDHLVHPRISSLKVVNWPTSPTLGGQRCGAWSRWY